MVIALPASSLKDVGDTAVCLQRIHFENIKRTKYDALVKEVRHVFTAKTLKDAVVKSYEAKRQMESDGLFDGMVVVLQSSPTVHDSGGPSGVSRPLDLDVTFVAKEPSRIRGSLQTGVNNHGEGQLGGDVSMRSVFGRGEVLSADVTHGHQKTSMWHASFLKPVLGWRSTAFSWHLFRQYYEQLASSYSSLENGAAMDLSHETLENLRHTVRFAATWRQLDCLSRTTAWAVREQAGHTLKCSLHQIIKHSTLDNEVLPRRGLLAKLAQEWAGFGGDVRFLRHDLELIGVASLFWDFFLSATCQLAYVSPRGGAQLSLIDRTYLGGPTNLRGFAYNSIGPATDGAFFGGMGSVAAGVHVFRPLFPRSLFLHGFALAGNVCPVDYGYNVFDALDHVMHQPRCSLGLGLALRLFGMARLELNYVWPISQYPTDVKQPGLQFGIGVSFL